MKLSVCTELWLENQQEKIKATSIRKYRQLSNWYILDNIDIPIINIDEKLVDDLIRKKLYGEKGLSAKTCNAALCVLRESLSFAVQSGYIPTNPCEKVKRLTEVKKQIEVFTPYECSLLENYIVGKRKGNLFGVLVSLYTGVRLGELLALRWQDVDFEKGFVSINKTLSDVGEETPPKSRSSTRVIPLHDRLLSLLRDKKQTAKSDYLIETNEGQTSVRLYQGKFERLLKKLGIKHRGFHTLRHTFATRLIESDVDVKTVSTLLGHSDFNITLAYYVHISSEMQRRAIEKLKI